jgi:prevent-host-death family protein
MSELTPSRKGAIAEAAIVHECIKLGLEVLRPFGEGRRYDLVIDNGQRLLRAQVKWGQLRDDHLVVRTSTSRHTPRGYVRTTYASDEIEGFAVHCEHLAACYWLPIEEFAGQSYVHLRLGATRNGQRGSIRWAAEYPLGAVAQLARASGWQPGGQGFESPQLHLDETVHVVGANEFRNRFGWYGDRAAAGETIHVTRRGRPYLRLLPPEG